MNDTLSRKVLNGIRNKETCINIFPLSELSKKLEMSSFPLSQIVSDDNISLAHYVKFDLERFVLQGQETAKTFDP